MKTGVQNIVNVSGYNNGCGAHDFLHLFDENLEAINWDLPHCKELLEIFSKIYGVPATSDNLRKALDAIPGHVNKEIAFGPIVRIHMASTIGCDPQYRQSEGLFSQFLTAARSYLEGTNIEGSNESLSRANADYFEQLKAEFSRVDVNLDDFMTKNEDAIANYFKQSGFNNYITALCETENALLFTTDEINNYCRIMNIDLEIYDRDAVRISEHKVDKNPLFFAKLHNAGIHWRYEANNISIEEISSRNLETQIAPIDRHSIIRYIQENGWTEQNLRPLIQRVQSACRNEALDPDFLKLPIDPDYKNINTNDTLLCWQFADCQTKGAAASYRLANQFLSNELERGCEFDEDDFKARYFALSDAVAFGCTDEVELLTEQSIKPRL